MSFPIPVFSSRTRLYFFVLSRSAKTPPQTSIKTLYPARLTITAPGARQFLRANSNSLRRPHLRAARSRITLNLVFRCHQRFLRKQTKEHVLRPLPHGILHDPVFQRVKTNYHQPAARPKHARRRLQQCFQIIQFTVYEYSESLKSSSRRMNPLMLPFHWPGRGRYHLDKLRRRAYRPRPDNGSGDSPRPPFLTEFVNHIGQLALVDVVYHLFGGVARHGIHPHVERSFRLKTKSALRILKLQAAHAQVRQQAVEGSGSDVLGYLGKRAVDQSDLRPVVRCLCGRVAGATVGVRLQSCAGPFERRGVLIEANQMSRCAEAFCYFETVPAQAHRGIEKSPATLYG